METGGCVKPVLELCTQWWWVALTHAVCQPEFNSPTIIRKICAKCTSSFVLQSRRTDGWFVSLPFQQCFKIDCLRSKGLFVSIVIMKHLGILIIPFTNINNSLVNNERGPGEHGLMGWDGIGYRNVLINSTPLCAAMNEAKTSIKKLFSSTSTLY